MGISYLQTDMASEKLHRKTIAATVNQMLRGITNQVIPVTLSAVDVFTVVADPWYTAGGTQRPRITPSTALILVPIHINCVGDAIFYQTAIVGQITVAHNARSVANRDYFGILVGI